jgi:hypothetical protein
MKDDFIRIRRILHAGYIFESGDTKIIFDPIFENPFSVNCFAFPAVKFDRPQIKMQRFDAIFISHYHDDHCSFESLDHLDRATPIYVYCIFEELFEMLRELGFLKVNQLTLNQSVEVGAFRIIPQEAEDTDVDSIFEIHAAGLKVLNMVDAQLAPKTLNQLESNAPWDMVLWPFQTMRESDVLVPRWSSPWDGSYQTGDHVKNQLSRLRPRYVVPSSCQFIHEDWSWYNEAMFPISYHLFETEITNVLPKTQVVRLDPSASIELRRDSLTSIEGLPWVSVVEAGTVDFHYNPELNVPTTSSIAKRFPALSSEQAKAVQEFCRFTLLARYELLEWAHTDYFMNPKFWQLSVYDESGVATDYFYSIDKNKIERTLEKPKLISWSTEVPAFKLFRALNHGEALTSMYVRINDIDFQPHLHEDLRTADVMDDPLVRCLFTGEFGAYQKEQLKMLKLKTLTAPEGAL